MSVFEKIVYFLQRKMETPKLYGTWHIIALLLVIALTVFLVVKYRNAPDKSMRRILFAAWIIMVLLEIYKQIVFSMSSADGITAVWDFQWYAFPFQFCSTPLFALPFAAFLPEGKIRQAIMAFLSTFSLFAGLAVMIYPGDVFIDMIGINFQTMVHHGFQVALGIFISAYYVRKHTLKTFAGGIAVFAVFCSVAMALNFAVHDVLKIEETFNMFYISPYYDCTLPILSIIYKAVPYFAFLLIYILGFSLVAALFFGISKGIAAVCGKKKACEVKS